MKQESTYPVSRQVSRREAMEEMKRGERIGRRRAYRKAMQALAERKREREGLNLPYTYPLERQIGQRRGSIGRQLFTTGRYGRRLVVVS
jgi:hypothetical protein